LQNVTRNRSRLRLDLTNCHIHVQLFSVAGEC